MHRRFRRIQGREIYDEGLPLSFGSLKCDLPKMRVNDRLHDALSQPIALIDPIGVPTLEGLEKGLLNIERQSCPFVLYIEVLPLVVRPNSTVPAFADALIAFVTWLDISRSTLHACNLKG